MQSDTQQKRLITWRLDASLLERIDARAKALNRSRANFLAWAIESALEDAEDGVPDIALSAGHEVREPKVTPRKVDPPAPDDRSWQEIEMERRRARR